ncbi:MAG: lipoyl(octanoyl) transferase LipB [Cyclobacteriaceae bacterium]|nr:lipoyl(octanoyl) transferase LipB [Cyclobacteriaceae bacterium]
MIPVITKKTTFIHLGLVDYQQATDYQASLLAKIVAIKKENRERDASNQLPTENFLIFCEHPHVFTIGKSGDEENLKINKDELHTLDATYHHTNRGGDITYHGPGQIVGYPIIDLENFFTDIHKYMRLLEESVIQTLAVFGIQAGRIPGLTGVWLDQNNNTRARKICALGVKTSRWVTMHGFAFNVNTNQNYFDYIIPCGIADKAVTSLEKELGQKQDIKKIEAVLKQKIAEVFEMELV